MVKLFHKKFYFIFFICTIIAQTAAPLWAETTPIDISGYYKNLFIHSQSAASKEDINLDLQRLRLEFTKQADPWQFHLSLDNEAIGNDMANTADFNFIRSKEQQSLTAWDGDIISTDNDHLYLKHSIYRAYIKYYDPSYQVVLGKQAVDWGKLRFYSPTDLFNPLGPVDIEHDERVGIDALNINIATGSLSGITLVAAPDEDPEDARYGVKLYKTIQSYDLSLLAASIRKNTVLGFSFDGYLDNAGFRGEITHTMDDDQQDYLRVGLGMDYTFSEKIYFLAEQFYNGGNNPNNPDFSTSYRASQKIMSLRRNLSSFWLQYKFTPLVESNTYIIYDWDGQSAVFNPELRYNAKKNLDVMCGTQFVSGNNGTEFGDSEHVFYAELKWYF